ncbi:Ig-like domain repeat protein, partial [Salmonella enterica]|nr:Ig-like domain repeat protein [Salmonella enterica]
SDVGEGKHVLTVEVTDAAGNTATKTLDFSIDTKLSEPVITLNSADDTGVPGDGLTSSAQPSFTLQDIDADVVRVTVSVEHGGRTETFDVLQGAGGWSFTPAAAWADGSYTLKVTVEDEAGNIRHSAPLDVKVDTQTVIDRIELVNDSGEPADNLTNDVRPEFRVTVPEDVNAVRLSLDGGRKWVDATKASAGVWGYAWPSDVTEGAHVLTVEATDIAGNTVTRTLDFIIDTTLSTPTIELDGPDDTGVQSDNLTNRPQPTFILKHVDADAASVVVSVKHGGTTTTFAATNGAGGWRFTPASDWADGAYTLSVTVTDKAGNVSHSVPLTVNVDTHVTIDSIVLVNDSGVIGDNLTNEVRPHFRVTVPGDVNVVRLSLNDGKTWGNATQSASGDWEYIWPDDVTEGKHTLTVEATDIAGNKATQMLEFIIDTTLSTPTITLDAVDDSGVAGDNITNEKTPGFTINGIDADASQVMVVVTHNGKSKELALTQVSGRWHFTPDSDWTDGNYTLTVKVEDKAGNMSQSSPLTVTVDTQTVISSIVLVNDSGIVGDKMTNNVHPHFRVTVPEDVNVVRLSIDGGTTWGNATQSAVKGIWNYNWPTDVGDGKYTLMVEAIDAAGNKATQTLEFIVDATLSVPTITLDTANDSGVAGDNITNEKTPGFTINGIDADAIRVAVQVTHNGTNQEVELTQSGGQWHFTPASNWVDGNYTLTVKVEDRAGNINQSVPLAVTIDTQTEINSIVLVNDTGVPDDNLTNDVRPEFRVTVPEDVNAVRLSIDGGTTWVNATKTSAGIWNYSWTTDLTEGVHMLTVEATDIAGNTATRTLDFTVDTTLSVPTITLDTANDSGVAGDNITNEKTPGFTINGIDTDASRVVVTVTHNGTNQEVELTQIGGQWTFMPASDWTDGNYTLTVKVEDRAGNVSQSAPLAVTIDTQTEINNIVLVNDTGVPDDNLTNALRPEFRIEVPEDVNVVRLSIDGGKTWVDANKTSASVWDYNWTTDITDGVHTLTVKVTDVAGNTATRTLNFTVDTTLLVPTITLDNADDSGTKGDDLTNVNKPTFLLGNIDSDARFVTVEIQHGSIKEVLTATRGTDGRWHFTPDNVWGDGRYTLTVKVEDEAGNIRYSAPLSVTVDTDITINKIELVNDSGVVGDNMTNDIHPQFRVTVPEDVNSVRLSIDGGATWVKATQGAAGMWDYTWPDDVKDGKYTLQVEATDKAGNTITRMLEFTIDTTLSIPTIELDSKDDTGTQGDELTHRTQPKFILQHIDVDTVSVMVSVEHGGVTSTFDAIKGASGWSFTPTAPWGDGAYTLTVMVEDKAGNVSHSAPLTVTVDTQTAINSIELVNDTGIPGDSLTNAVRPHFRVAVPDDVKTVRLSIDGGKTWGDAKKTSAGVWDYSWLTDVTEGAHTLTVEATDVAGNTVKETMSFTIDTTLSVPLIALDSADDSGAKGDELTRVNRPTFLLDNIDNDARYVTVEVQHGSVREVLKATQSASGRWSFTPVGDWADGQYTLTVKVEDEAGNIRQSAPLTVTVDTQTAIDGIELVNDHGISGDNLTSALRPEFRVTTPGDVNAVRLSLDGDTNWVNATKNAAGVWEYSWPGDVGEGKHTLTVEATDAAGNTATRTLDFTVDTTLSVPVITLDSADDSGNRGDNVTSVRSPGFTIENIDPDVRRVTVQIAHDGSSREVALTQTGG